MLPWGRVVVTGQATISVGTFVRSIAPRGEMSILDGRTIVLAATPLAQDPSRSQSVVADPVAGDRQRDLLSR